MTPRMSLQLQTVLMIAIMAAVLYVTHGRFNQSWIAGLAVFFVMLFVQLPALQWFEKPQIKTGAYFLLILGFTFTTLFSIDPANEAITPLLIHVRNQDFVVVMQALYAAAALCVVALYVFCHFKKSNRTEIFLFALILISVASALCLIIQASPSPFIDVWSLHENAAQALADGRNPYSIDYPNIYPPDLQKVFTPFGIWFPYLPGVFILMAPFKLLGLDTRYTQILAHVLTAIVIFLISRRVLLTNNENKRFLVFVPSLLFLFFPYLPHFIESSWNDNLNILFYTVAAWAILQKRVGVLYVATNALLLLKQYNIVFYPLLLWFAVVHLKDRFVGALLKSTFAAWAVCGFFLALNCRDFLGSLYGLGFIKHAGVDKVFTERTDSFSLMNWIYLAIGIKGAWVFLILTILLLAWMIFNYRKVGLNLLAAIGMMGAAATCLFAFAPIAFGNYYWFSLGFFFIAIALMHDPEPRESEERSPYRWMIPISWLTFTYMIGRIICLFVLPIDLRPTAAFFESASTRTFLDADVYSMLSFVPIKLTGMLNETIGASEPVHFHFIFIIIALTLDLTLFSYFSKLKRRGSLSSIFIWIYLFGSFGLAPFFFVRPDLFIGALAIATGILMMIPILEVMRRLKSSQLTAKAIRLAHFAVASALWLGLLCVSPDGYVSPMILALCLLPLAGTLPRLQANAN